MAALRKFIASAMLVLIGSTAQADRKQDAFYVLLDNASDNPILQKNLQASVLGMFLRDARDRGLGLADTVLLRADRNLTAWNDDILVSRNLPPDRLDLLLAEKLAQMSSVTEQSRLMRLLQTSTFDCSSAETVTVYLVTNLVSSISLNAIGAHLDTAPSVSLSGCDIVFVGPTLGSPDLGLREVQHIDDLIAKLSVHFGADGHVILR